MFLLDVRTPQDRVDCMIMLDYFFCSLVKKMTMSNLLFKKMLAESGLACILLVDPTLYYIFW